MAPGSQTPTYAALKLYIDNWRWQGVPFYLRSGKALMRKTSEIIIEFQRPPHLMFHLPEGSEITPNILSLCIQPDEGIHLRFEAKVPDFEQAMRSVDMDFHYRSSFNGSLPEAYERLSAGSPGRGCVAFHPQRLDRGGLEFARTRSCRAGRRRPRRAWWSIRLAAGGRRRRTNCWHGMGGAGAWDAWTSRASSMPVSRVKTGVRFHK